MLANRPRSSTRQGRLIFSAPAKSPSSGRSAVSLHTRTKLRQFNSWSAVVQPYLRNFSQDLRGWFVLLSSVQEHPSLNIDSCACGNIIYTDRKLWPHHLVASDLPPVFEGISINQHTERPTTKFSHCDTDQDIWV